MCCKILENIQNFKTVLNSLLFTDIILEVFEDVCIWKTLQMYGRGTWIPKISESIQLKVEFVLIVLPLPMCNQCVICKCMSFFCLVCTFVSAWLPECSIQSVMCVSVAVLAVDSLLSFLCSVAFKIHTYTISFSIMYIC